jgi:hypothetical protein
MVGSVEAHEVLIVTHTTSLIRKEFLKRMRVVGVNTPRVAHSFTHCAAGSVKVLYAHIAYLM